MTIKEKLKIIEEIKKLEEKLYLKKSKLAVEKSKTEKYVMNGLIIEEKNIKQATKIFSRIIKLIGKRSSGGNSVKDVRKQRERVK